MVNLALHMWQWHWQPSGLDWHFVKSGVFVLFDMHVSLFHTDFGIKNVCPSISSYHLCL